MPEQSQKSKHFVEAWRKALLRGLFPVCSAGESYGRRFFFPALRTGVLGAGLDFAAAGRRDISACPCWLQSSIE
jgi:hypothetical protein